MLKGPLKTNQIVYRVGQQAGDPHLSEPPLKWVPHISFLRCGFAGVGRVSKAGGNPASPMRPLGMAEWYTQRFESVMAPRALLWWFLPHLKSEMWGTRPWTTGRINDHQRTPG